MKIKKNCKSLLILALLSALLTSCATIVNGSNQSVTIASDPSNANVWVDKNFIGNTPIIAKLTRKDDHIVRIELEGFHPYELRFSKSVSGWVFGNIAFGGFIGLAVDAITGAIYVLTPEQIQSEMQSNNISYVKRCDDSFVTVVLMPNPCWKKIGNLPIER